MRWHDAKRERPADGQWCWLISDSIVYGLFIAKADCRALGGWTNDDTYEDFSHAVLYWYPITDPPRLVSSLLTERTE